MDFIVVDSTYGDSLAKGDIVFYEGDIHQITGGIEDDLDLVTYTTYNLETDDHDHVIYDPNDRVDIYQAR